MPKSPDQVVDEFFAAIRPFYLRIVTGGMGAGNSADDTLAALKDGMREALAEARAAEPCSESGVEFTL